jgi:hypothetical protein
MVLLRTDASAPHPDVEIQHLAIMFAQEEGMDSPSRLGPVAKHRMSKAEIAQSR